MANYKTETTTQLSRVKKYFRSQGPLYFKNVDKIIISKGTPEETLDKIIEYIRVPYNTIDSEGNKVTGNAYRRSLKELYRLMYATHPALRVITLIELIFKKMKAGLCDSVICSRIHKRVYYFSKEPWQSRSDVSKVFSGEAIDEFRLNWKDILSNNDLKVCNAQDIWGHNLGEKDLLMEEIN